MGFTNIHRGNDFLECAGTVSQQAIIANLNQFVQLCMSSASDAQCQIYMNMLQSGLIDKWFSIEKNGTGKLAYNIKSKPEALKVPKIRLSEAFNQQRYPQTPNADSYLGNESDLCSLAYVLVVQAADAGHTTKLVVCHDAAEAGDTIMFEALNGCSTVFGAGILREAADTLLQLSSHDPEKKLKSLRFERIVLQGPAVRRSAGKPEYASLALLTDVHKPSVAKDKTIAFIN